MGAIDSFGTLKAAAALILHVNSAFRQLWLRAGGDDLESNDGAMYILSILKINRTVVRFL